MTERTESTGMAYHLYIQEAANKMIRKDYSGAADILDANVQPGEGVEFFDIIESDLEKAKRIAVEGAKELEGRIPHFNIIYELRNGRYHLKAHKFCSVEEARAAKEKAD